MFRTFTKNIINKLLTPLGLAVSRLSVPNPNPEKLISIENFFDVFFSKINVNEFFFVEIGANDGKTYDPIYSYVTKYGLKGIVVEPQSDVFKVLQKNYSRYSNVQCVNVAIGKETGVIPFYAPHESIKNKENFIRLTGKAGLNKNVTRKTIKKKLPKGINVDNYIQETSVQALSLQDFISKYGVTRIDMLQIDCEGYDYEILKTLEFTKFSPSIINFESTHLSREDLLACEQMLEERGYKWFKYDADICAYKL